MVIPFCIAIMKYTYCSNVLIQNIKSNKMYNGILETIHHIKDSMHYIKPHKYDNQRYSKTRIK